MTRRLVLGSVVLTMLVLLVLEIPLGLTAADRQRDELSVQLERDAVALAAFVEDALEGTEEANLQEIADNYQTRTGARAVIVDSAGVALADSDPAGEVDRSFRSRPEIAESLSGAVASGSRRSDTLDTNLLYVAVPVASGGDVLGAVRLSYPTSEVDERVRETWLTLAGVAVVSLAAAVVLGIVLARSVARPLRRLQRAATRLGGGDLTARAPDDAGPREVRALTAAFNDTADRLSALVTAQEEFVAEASHQLRTPLTALQLRLENLEPAATGSDQEDVDAALGELARMSRLVDGLLALARADRQGAPVATSAVVLADALEERASVWEPVARDQAVDITVSCPDGVEVLATPDRLSQVLDNLLANAMEVAPPESTVRLVAERAGSHAVLHVADEGPGMSEEHRQHAFDRFWRGEGAGRGSGLGLAIVQKLVRADGGGVSLHRAATGGLDVRLRLRALPA